MQRFIFSQRYSLVNAMKRLMGSQPVDEKTIRAVLAEVSTDNSRYDIVLRWLDSDNPRPNP